MPGRVSYPAAPGESSPSETSSGSRMPETLEVSEAAAEPLLDVLGRLILDEKRPAEVEAGEPIALIEIARTPSGPAPAQPPVDADPSAATLAADGPKGE